MATNPLTVTRLDDEAIWRVAIGGSKGNILDAVAMQALTDLFREAAASPHLKAICLEGQGAHFSFGASVPEHLPPHVEAMLESFHGALLAMIDSAVPVLAAVRGQCLGGGLELVSLCQRVVVAHDARLGQPEMVLGVFAPVASLVLAGRVGCRDQALDTVRAWKARTGGLAVGFLPIYVPRELLHAQGVLPVGLMGGRPDLEIIKGDAYYQSYICHLPRSTIELGLNGSYGALDGLVFPAICDVIRNLSGMWQMLFPDMLVHYFDVPQNFDPAIGGAFYRRDLEALAQALAARGASPLTAEALRHSIALYNEHRRLVRELYALRRREPWKVPTHELYVVMRAALLMPVEESTPMFADYLALTAADESRLVLRPARLVGRRTRRACWWPARSASSRRWP